MNDSGILAVLLRIETRLGEALEKHDERIAKLERKESWLAGVWWAVTGVAVTAVGFLVKILHG